MTMNIGDKCPQCKEGLLVRTEMGMACDQCSFEQDIAAVVEANAKAQIEIGEYKFRAASIKIRIESPEAGEEFLRGIVLASQNNNSQLFRDLLDGVNAVLEPHRAAVLRREMAERAAAGMR